MRLHCQRWPANRLQHCSLQSRGREWGAGALGAGMRGWGAASKMGLEGWVSWRWQGRGGRLGEGSRCTGWAGVRGCTLPKGRVINKAGGGPRWLSLMDSTGGAEQGSEGEWKIALYKI